MNCTCESLLILWRISFKKFFPMSTQQFFGKSNHLLYIKIIKYHCGPTSLTHSPASECSAVSPRDLCHNSWFKHACEPSPGKEDFSRTTGKAPLLWNMSSLHQVGHRLCFHVGENVIENKFWAETNRTWREREKIREEARREEKGRKRRKEKRREREGEAERKSWQHHSIWMPQPKFA